MLNERIRKTMSVNIVNDGFDDIITIIIDNINEIPALINIANANKKLRDIAINTRLYKEEKKKRENVKLCDKIEDIIIEKIFKKIEDSEYITIMNELKKGLNIGCVIYLADIIHNDYVYYCHDRYYTCQYVAIQKSEIISDIIKEFDKNYKIYMDNWWKIDESDNEYEEFDNDY